MCGTLSPKLGEKDLIQIGLRIMVQFGEKPLKPWFYGEKPVGGTLFSRNVQDSTFELWVKTNQYQSGTPWSQSLLEEGDNGGHCNYPLKRSYFLQGMALVGAPLHSMTLTSRHTDVPFFNMADFKGWTFPNTCHFFKGFLGVFPKLSDVY